MSTLIDAAARELYKTFVAQGVTHVYGTRCCGRVYLGQQPAMKCRTCQGQPKNVEIAQEGDLDNLSAG